MIVPLRLGQMTAADLVGLPSVSKQGKIQEYAVPWWLSSLKAGDVLLLQEYERAWPEVRDIVQSMADHGRAGSHVLPDGVEIRIEET